MENETTLQTEFHDNAPIMKVGDWLIVLLLLIIPVVNLIMLLIWAFGSDTNPNKSNYAKAALIWMLIWVVLYVFFIVVFGAAFLFSNGF